MGNGQRIVRGKLTYIFILCLVGLFVVFAWYIGLAVTEGQVGMVEGLPMVNAILIFLARKGILDDEKLVRAADRIR